MCKLVYKMDIQIYDQISILRNCSKVKLCRTVSLGLGLKGVKIIAWSVAKFGMHDDRLSNGHPNLWSSFHSKKYVKSEPPWYIFVRVWVKGVKNNSEYHESWHALLSSKCTSKSMIKFQFWETAQKWNSSVHDCLSNGHPNLWSSFHSKKYVKSENPSYSFVTIWIKGAENNSSHHETWRATYHPNAHQKIWSNFNSEKFVKSETPLCGWG